MNQGNKLSLKKNLVIGLMLFAMFLGAGNVIFPPLLGQMAGEKLFIAIIGFLLAAVGLPFLAIVTIARVGDLQELGNRVHPVFSIVFAILIYTMLGPFFGIPRTATVSYEIGIYPFLSESFSAREWPLTIFSIVFFGITLFLALNPSKIVDRMGKFLTPILLIIIALFTIKSVLTPIGILETAQGVYGESTFFSSFVQGYLTMDVLAALILGIFIVNLYRDEGITERKEIVRSTLITGSIIAIGLSFVYISLSYIGATSTSAIGFQDNGGAILALSAQLLFGQGGAYILALIIILACLTTSIGLVLVISQFFNRIFPRVSYKAFVYFFSVAGALVANVGLTNLISIALPVLMIVYPLAIVLVLLSFIDKLFGQSSIVYITTIIFTFFVSVFEGVKAAGIVLAPIEKLLSKLPLYEFSMGWVVPAFVGLFVGVILHFIFNRKPVPMKINV